MGGILVKGMHVGGGKVGVNTLYGVKGFTEG